MPKIVKNFDNYIKEEFNFNPFKKKTIDKYEDFDLDLKKPIKIYLSTNKDLSVTSGMKNVVIKESGIKSYVAGGHTYLNLDMSVSDEDPGDIRDKLIYDIYDNKLIFMETDTKLKQTFLASTDKEGAKVIYNTMMFYSDEYPELEYIDPDKIPQQKIK